MNDLLTQAMECFQNHEWKKAEELFSLVEDTEKAQPYLKKCRLYLKYFVGNTVPFGHYQGRELTWRVLEERGNMRLLVADTIVTALPYQNLYIDTYWENASIRSWLNKDFLNEAFTAEERRSILSTRIETPANEYFFTNGGPRTMDKVFLLSKPELVRYLPEEADRNLGQLWWIRTPGSSLLTASIVYSDGTFYRGGVNVNSKTVGVRPAMWVLLKG